MKQILYISIVDISKKNGQGIYALKTLESFIKYQNIKIYIVLPKPKDIKVLEKIISYDNVELFLLPQKKERNIFQHFYIQISLFFILFKIKKVNAIVYSLKPMMISPIIYKMFSKTDIYLLVEGLAKNTINTITKGIFSKIGLKILELNIKKATKVYPAYLSAKQWVDNIRKRKDSKIIYCGVDLDKFKPIMKKQTKKLTIGYVGSFREVHKLEFLIDSIVNLNIKLLLIGNGIEKNKIIEKIKLKNIDYEYIGEIEQDKIYKYFSYCDVMWGVIDIKHWGVPIKIFEYLACNKKVIYTIKEDLNFIDKNKWGYELKEVSKKEISSLLDDLIIKHRQNLLKDNINSREYIKNNNNWDNFANIILKDVK